MWAPKGTGSLASASALALIIGLAGGSIGLAGGPAFSEEQLSREQQAMRGREASRGQGLALLSLASRPDAQSPPNDEGAEAPSLNDDAQGVDDAHGPADPASPQQPAVEEKDLAPPAEAPAAATDGDAETAPAAEKAADSPALPAVNAALKAVLEARAEAPGGAAQKREREAVAAFYVARDFAPLWWTDGKANAEVKPVLDRLERAGEDGLNLKDYPLKTGRTDAPEAIAAADVALSEAVAAYGRQASGGRIDPHALSPLIGARPEVADPSLVLALVSTAGAEAGTTLQNFNPPQRGYAALRDKLAELRRPRRLDSEAAIPSGPTLRVGMRDPRVPLIRARFSLDGNSDEGARGLVYDSRVASAVADFQKANGLPASGVLTARTIAALSGGHPSRLEAEILANMERWRWMPRDMGEDRVEVNIPDFEVVVFENGQVAERSRVVVGKEETPTPIFSNTMQFLIVNPSWNVPQSIIRKEMLPRLAGDPGYLRRLGYQASYEHGRLTVRQPPGERNALGRIKFMFPNDYSVYLHDTPSRALFAEAKRAFSHGCVRVDDPFRFAQAVLGAKWSEKRIKTLIGGKERYVNLPKPLPIYLEYFTTYVDDSGRLQVRDDIYGYSHRVKAALGLEG